ncbi:hypothetical protein BH10ACI3_BH10ACI3_27490 [soil metagenome]
MRKTILFIGATTLFTLITLTAACSSAGSGGGTSAPAGGKTIVSGPAGNNLTATLANADGAMKKGNQELTLTFTDASGKPVDVGSAALNFRMPAMGGMSEMNSGATFTTTGTPGSYKGKVDLEMGGEWQAMVTYEGPAGKGAFTLKAVAK